MPDFERRFDGSEIPNFINDNLSFPPGMMLPRLNTEWLRYPEFEQLYSTWSEIITPGVDGRLIGATKALEMLRDAENNFAEETGLPLSMVQGFSQMAREYATLIPGELLVEAMDYL